MADNLAIFARFYSRPARAASDALDRGSFGFAIILAALVMLLWTFGAPRTSLVNISVAGGLFGVFALFVVMTPVSIAVLAAWDGLGSPGVVLRREYMSFVVCGLMAWAAAHLPFGLFVALSGTPLISPFLSLAAHLAFVLLFVICLRTALGTTVGHAIVATLAGWFAALGAVLLWPIVGNFSYFLLSPWVLYMLYRAYSPDVRSLGDMMNSRRAFRRQLDAAMLNPRDADAHYQLGLIYQQRRQLDEAAASFRRAIDILPEEADAHHQLGRVLRAQGNSSEALAHLEAAVKADKNVGRQEGWRDLGATLLELGRANEAIPVLERYTNSRSYDPEGLFVYALALKQTGRTADARQALQQTIEAVQTAPAYRKGQLRRWASQANSELKSL